MKKLIIVPAYNEEMSIKNVVDDVRSHLQDVDIVVVNDGSGDNTEQVALQSGVTVVTLPYNLGIGGAVQTGYIYAERYGYDIAIQFDGDGQHKADQISILLEPLLRNETDIVIGSRFREKGMYRSGWARYVGIKLLSRILSLICRQDITDPTSGFRAVGRNVISYVSRIYPDDYPEPESLVILHRAGFRIGEVPVLMRKRQGGKTSITPIRSLYYMVKVLLAIGVDVIKRIHRIHR